MEIPDPLLLDELPLVSARSIFFLPGIVSAKGTTGSDRVWLVKGRICKLVATQVGLHSVFKNEKVHMILTFGFSLLLRGYNQLE